MDRLTELLMNPNPKPAPAPFEPCFYCGTPTNQGRNAQGKMCHVKCHTMGRKARREAKRAKAKGKATRRAGFKVSHG